MDSCTVYNLVLTCVYLFFQVMPPPPRSTRTDTPLPYPTLFRSCRAFARRAAGAALRSRDRRAPRNPRRPDPRTAAPLLPRRRMGAMVRRRRRPRPHAARPPLRQLGADGLSRRRGPRRRPRPAVDVSPRPRRRPPRPALRVRPRSRPPLAHPSAVAPPTRTPAGGTRQRHEEGHGG